MSLRFSVAALLISLSGCTFPAGGPQVPASAEHAEGRRLYITKCARCHKLYDARNYSDRDWQAWMTKMAKKSRLSPDQQEEISSYVEKVIRKPD